MVMLAVTFRRRSRSRQVHQARFALGSDYANALEALGHAWRTNSEIIYSVSGEK